MNRCIPVIFAIMVLASVGFAQTGPRPATMPGQPGLQVTRPPKTGIVLWPAGARIQQVFELGGNDLAKMLQGQPGLERVRSIFIADYMIPGPPAAPSNILEFYTGTLRAPAWQPFFQNASAGPDSASIAFKGPKGYISVLARPNGATVTFVEGNIDISAIPLMERVLREALSSNDRGPMDARDKVDAALQMRQAGRIDDATRLLQRIVTDYPQSAIAHFELAKLLAEQRDYNQSGEHFRRAIGLLPLDVMFRAGYAQFLMDLGDFENAQHELEQAATMDPWSPQLQSALGRVLEGREMFAEAEARFRKAIELAGNVLDFYMDLGRVMEKEGKQKEALTIYKDTLKLKSDFPPAVDAIHRLEAAGTKDQKDK